jgi:hypothetical protein
MMSALWIERSPFLDTLHIDMPSATPVTSHILNGMLSINTYFIYLDASPLFIAYRRAFIC